MVRWTLLTHVWWSSVFLCYFLPFFADVGGFIGRFTSCNHLRRWTTLCQFFFPPFFVITKCNSKWQSVVRPKNGHDFSWGLLLGVARVCYKVGVTQEHTAKKTAEPFHLYMSHLVTALQPLNTSELTVLGSGTPSHSCHFCPFLSVNVLFFLSLSLC